METKCKKCGVSVVITEVRSAGYSFEIKPSGLSLADQCPIIVERKAAGSTDDSCPNLTAAVEARIERFREEHP